MRLQEANAGAQIQTHIDIHSMVSLHIYMNYADLPLRQKPTDAVK